MAAKKSGKRLIFRPWITTKSGRRIHAHWFGKKAFAIWVEDEQ